MCIPLLLDEVIYRCQLYPVIDGVVEFSCILPNLLPAGSISTEEC